MKRDFWLASSHFGEKCNDFRMLELFSEYSLFIMDLDAEESLINHIQKCHECLAHVKQLIHNENPSYDWWRNLFSTDQSNILEKSQWSRKQANRNSFERYSFTDEFIRERIQWRIDRIQELKADAELELESLKKQIELDQNDDLT
jgi:hypothetical protein